HVCMDAACVWILSRETEFLHVVPFLQIIRRIHQVYVLTGERSVFPTGCLGISGSFFPGFFCCIKIERQLVAVSFGVSVCMAVQWLSIAFHYPASTLNS